VFIGMRIHHKLGSTDVLFLFRFRYSFIRPGDSAVTYRQAATCYYQSNHSKVEAIPLSALPKDTISELTGCRPISTVTLLNAERQAGKL